ncbi:MAG: hypothetical protein Q7T13_08900, partial [Polaromonas sp.]|nr:hypothetical protein [Polaromonas sp.]
RFDRAPQVARSEAEGPRPSGRLFFGDFLLAKQKKVTCRRATPGLLANHTARGAEGFDKLNPNGVGGLPAWIPDQVGDDNPHCRRYEFNSWWRSPSKG